MVNFVADNVGFNDVNLRNLKIEYTKAETVGGSETIKYPFDSLCFVANGTGFASLGGKTWRDLSRGAALAVTACTLLTLLQGFSLYASWQQVS